MKGLSPSLLQYGINLPFHFAVIGQTDSGKTHSIVRCWLGGKIQCCKYANGKLTNAYLQHCLYCSNSDISEEEKDRLRDEIIKDDDQRLFHLTCVPNREELFAFIAETSDFDDQKTKKKEYTVDDSDIVSKESMETAPNRVNSTMKLLMTKLSNHNNISVLIVCHELYPKGQNSVLFIGQLTGVHLHSVADTRKARTYFHNFYDRQ